MALKRWTAFLGLVLYLGLILRSSFLVGISITVLIILGLASMWKRYSVEGVIYQRRFLYTRAFPGEQFPVSIEIENRKVLPLSWLRIVDPWPRAIAPEDEERLSLSHTRDMGYLNHVFSLLWHQRTRRKYDLLHQRRGVYKIGPALLETGDMFGIYNERINVGSIERISVFPTPIPIPQVEMQADTPFGDKRSRRRIYEDPNLPMGMREYHPEDSFRHIHWPATARTGQVQVKVFQPTSEQVSMLCLNISTYPRYWEGVYPELLEYLLGVAASLVSEGIHNGYRVGIVSNGCLENSDQPFRIPAGRSPQQLGRLLEALAGVSPVVVAPFERFLLREIPRVPYGATLLILTAIYSDELAETLLRLKKHERQITLISLAERPPGYIKGVPTVHFPFHSPDMYQAVNLPPTGQD